MSDGSGPVTAGSGVFLSGDSIELSSGLLGGVADWVMDSAIADLPADKLLEGACVRLLAAGLPIARAHMSYRTLHPSIESVSLLCDKGEPVRAMEHMHGAGSSAIWQRSPFYFMIQNDLVALRRRLAGPAALIDFVVLEDLQADGYTDYLALMVKFDDGPVDSSGRGNRIVTSWTTRRHEGCVNDDIAALLRVKQRLGVAAKMAIKNQIATNVVSTYLGPTAGAQVLSGNIQRGDGQTIHAVIFYSDLRGSSGLADRLPGSAYISLLNGYFECAAGAVLDAGGEVLNYIGDGVLAIFPIGEMSEEEAAEAALGAAKEARRRLQDVNENLRFMGRDPLEFGVALHVGDVVFGNMGSGGRLAFTTIGSAVNKVARLETLPKTLDAPILMSGEFKSAVKRADPSVPLTGFGFQKMRGIGAPIDVFGINPDELTP